MGGKDEGEVKQENIKVRISLNERHVKSSATVAAQ